MELIFLIAALFVFPETAKRRGVPAWPFMVVAGVGWFVIGNLAAALLGVGPHLLFSWAWIGLTYLSIFIIGGAGRRMKDTWQCPNCKLFNPPSTIICPCGYDPATREPSDGAVVQSDNGKRVEKSE